MNAPLPFPPFVKPLSHVSGVMLEVLLALIPGVSALVWHFGWGVLVQIGLAVATALWAEALVLSLRRRRVWPAWRDGSATVTAVLLAVSLPPLLPWWATVLGVLFAMIVGKQLYGGLGYNPFNPAMVGYAVLLVSFPRQMTAWLPPSVGLSWSDCVAIIFQLDKHTAVDGLAMATPLDMFKTELNRQTAMDEIMSAKVFGGFSGRGWQWVNMGFMAGGLWLLKRGVIDWRIPAGFLGSLLLWAMWFFLSDPSRYPNPLFHAFGGAAMLGAFFIATDPVTAATTPLGRWIYGALIGSLVYVIRCWGGYPDGVAFAVLVLNFAVPTLDHYTRPRVYGHER